MIHRDEVPIVPLLPPDGTFIGKMYMDNLRYTYECENSVFNTKETEFVKNIRDTHCKGCRNECMPCNACAVLDCWLRKTYLPEGEWRRASEYDLHTKLMKDITDDINKRIIEELNHKYNNYGE